MKVLHVIPSFAPAWRYGGPVIAAYGMACALARQGHDVAVMTTNIDGGGVLDVPLDRPVEMDGISVWYFSVQRPRWYCFSKPLARALKERVADFDIVHIHSIFLWPTTVAGYWCRKRGVPYIVHPFGSLDTLADRQTYQSFWSGRWSRLKKRVYMRSLAKWDLNRASGIQYTSRADLEASRMFNLRPQGYVLPLGVDPPAEVGQKDGQELSRRYPELAGKKLVLFLSRLAPGKGLEILLSALGELASRRDDFALVVAGSGPVDYQAGIASLVRSVGLQDRTVFLGFVEGAEKWRALGEAHLFVLPSHHENFPIALMEAMASGLAVVISDRVKVHQVVADAGAGLVTGLDPAEVDAAVEYLLQDDDRRERMGDAGRRLVRREYTWDRVAQMTAQVYRRIVSGKQPVTEEVVAHAAEIDERSGPS